MAAALAAQVEQHASLLAVSKEAADAVAAAVEENVGLRAVCDQLRAVGTGGGEGGGLKLSSTAPVETLFRATTPFTAANPYAASEEAHKISMSIVRARAAAAESHTLLNNARAGAQHLLLLLAALRVAAGAPPARPVTPSSLARRLSSAAAMLHAVATHVAAYEAAEAAALAGSGAGAEVVAGDAQTQKLKPKPPAGASNAPSPRTMAALGQVVPGAKALFAPRVAASLSIERRRGNSNSNPSAANAKAPFGSAVEKDNYVETEWGKRSAAFGATSVEVNVAPQAEAADAAASAIADAATTTDPHAHISSSSSKLHAFSRGPALADRLRSRVTDSAALSAPSLSAQAMFFNELGAPLPQQQRPMSALMTQPQETVIDQEVNYTVAQRRALKRSSAGATAAHAAAIDAEARAAAFAAAASAAADAALETAAARRFRPPPQRVSALRSAANEAAARASSLSLLAAELGKPTLATISPTATAPERAGFGPTRLWHAGA